MKRKMMYVCEICGEVFPDDKYAKMCEQKHIQISKVIEVLPSHLIGCTSDVFPYPHGVRIKMEDGTVHNYTYKGRAW